MLAEMVIAIDRHSAEVAYLGATAARHPVAAFRLDEASSTLVTLPNACSCHLLFTEKENRLKDPETDQVAVVQDVIREPGTKKEGHMYLSLGPGTRAIFAWGSSKLLVVGTKHLGCEKIRSPDRDRRTHGSGVAQLFNIRAFESSPLLWH